MKAVQFRIARPTNRLKEIVRFYHEAVGLEILGRFDNHEGYDGVMLGLPDKRYHLEFTQHTDQPELAEPSGDHLLVLYFDKEKDYNEANDRLKSFGAEPVEPDNPYWKQKSKTYKDPDGWHIVLFNGVFNS